MLIAIPAVLDAAGLARLRAVIASAEWVDGNVTSGRQSALAKRNRQLPEGGKAAREAGADHVMARSAFVLQLPRFLDPRETNG